jgi:hypothetical protein
MYRFSQKVNKRRRIREIKRQSIHRLIAPYNNPSNDNVNDDNDQQLLQRQDGEQQDFESKF